MKRLISALLISVVVLAGCEREGALRPPSPTW